MAKQLQFTYKGVDYTLEFTRKTVEMMERSGFVAAEAKDKPMLTLPALFDGAFLAHHRNVKPEVRREIFELMTDKGELIGKLAEMYNEPISTLLDDPKGDTGNVNWTASW